MALTHERNKSARTKRGCLLCMNVGAASTPYAYVTVKFIPMFKKGEVVKEIGLCFKHSKARTENNPNGILDPEVGLWMNPWTGEVKQGGGGVAIREELYALFGDDITLLTGPSGKIPLWW